MKLLLRQQFFLQPLPISVMGFQSRSPWLVHHPESLILIGALVLSANCGCKLKSVQSSSIWSIRAAVRGHHLLLMWLSFIAKKASRVCVCAARCVCMRTRVCMCVGACVYVHECVHVAHRPAVSSLHHTQPCIRDTRSPYSHWHHGGDWNIDTTSLIASLRSCQLQRP